jgi:hypothetical protein
MYRAAKKAEKLVDALAEKLYVIDGEAMIEGDEALYILADALQEAYNQGKKDQQAAKE